MSSTIDPHKTQTVDHTTTTYREGRRATIRWEIVGISLWLLGLATLSGVGYILHFHHNPYPFELQLSRTVQATSYWPGVTAWLSFTSILNDIPPSIAAIVLWFVGLLLVGT